MKNLRNGLLYLIMIGFGGSSCAVSNPNTEIRDTRTAGYPSGKPYYWLIGGVSKTKKHKSNKTYIAPKCGQCKR